MGFRHAARHGAPHAAHRHAGIVELHGARGAFHVSAADGAVGPCPGKRFKIDVELGGQGAYRRRCANTGVRGQIDASPRGVNLRPNRQATDNGAGILCDCGVKLHQRRTDLDEISLGAAQPRDPSAER